MSIFRLLKEVNMPFLSAGDRKRGGGFCINEKLKKRGRVRHLKGGSGCATFETIKTNAGTQPKNKLQQ